MREKSLLFRVIWTLLLMLGPLVAPTSNIRDQQWHLAYLHIDQAQSVSQGEGVVVAVIDTGVDGNHPDLSGSVLPGVDLLPSSRSDDGRVDSDGHGTGMAGLIAAHGQALGIAPKAKVLPVRAVEDVQTFGQSKVGPGIDWAVDNGASVINLSLGSMSDDPVERAAIQRALARNVVVVASAGNRPTDRSVDYPAAYPGVLAVVGVDRHGNHAAISVTGPQAVIAAPAVDIASTDIRTAEHGIYTLTDGTSDAAAIVSGVVALVRSRFPSLSAQDVVHRLEATADDRGPPGRDDLYGFGIVNPVKALTADVPPLTPSASAEPPTTGAVGPSSNETNWTPIVVVGVGVLLVVGLVTAGLVTRRR